MSTHNTVSDSDLQKRIRKINLIDKLIYYHTKVILKKTLLFFSLSHFAKEVNFSKRECVKSIIR